MKLYFVPYNLCVPRCKSCGLIIERHSIVTKDNNHYHPACLETEIIALLNYVTEQAKSIVDVTQDNNLGANVCARRILAYIEDSI